jgi:hypothetical protein
MLINTTAHIKTGTTLTQSTDIRKGPKQRCSVSRLLFHIYTEQVLEMWYGKCAGMGVKTEDRTLHSLLIADDQIIFA